MNDDDVGPVLLDRRCGVVRRRGFGDDTIARLFQKEPNEVALERASIRDDGGRLRGLSSQICSPASIGTTCIDVYAR